MSGRPEGDKLISQLEADVTKEREKTLKAVKEIDFCLDYHHLLTVYEPQAGMEMDQVIHTALSKGEILNVSLNVFYLIEETTICIPHKQQHSG